MSKPVHLLGNGQRAKEEERSALQLMNGPQVREAGKWKVWHLWCPAYKFVQTGL